MRNCAWLALLARLAGALVVEVAEPTHATDRRAASVARRQRQFQFGDAAILIKHIRFFSIISVRAPFSATAIAAASPALPLPTTITSKEVIGIPDTFYVSRAGSLTRSGTL